VNDTVWQTNFTPLGRARVWLEADTQTDLPPFLDQVDKTHWLDWMRRPNATDAGLNAYRSLYQGVNDAAEANLTDDDWVLHVPVLAIGGALDAAGRPEFLEATKPWAAAGYHSKVLNGGHWLMRELPQEVNELLIGFGRE
jgi:pimeloyl-ACP methyl ester carboxylesterase